MKKRALCLLMAGLMCVSLAGCGSSDSGKETTKAAEGGAAEESKEAGNEESKDGLKVCIVYTGNLGDKSYNDSCNIGAQKAVEDFGIELKSLEGTTAQEWEANLVAAWLSALLPTLQIIFQNMRRTIRTPSSQLSIPQ